jgi:hypothetical protein
MALQRLLRILRLRGDDLVETLQARGLDQLSTLACRLLDEPPPRDGEWLPWETRTLDAILDRMCAYTRPDLPRPDDTDALESTLDFVDTFPQGRRRQLRQLLAVVEAGPLVLAPAGERERFSELSAEAADTYLRGWDESALPPRRAAFRALKSVCMMGYWSQPDTWDGIGYSLEDNPGLDAP